MRRRPTPQDIERERAELEAQMGPLYDALDGIRYDHLDGSDPQEVARAVVSGMIRSGYRVTDPDGNPLVKDPI
jgi:hypothetical protein